MKFAPMAIPAMALLQQHDARWDIVIEPAARRSAAIEARGHSELGAQSSRKNQAACASVCALDGCYTIAGFTHRQMGVGASLDHEPTGPYHMC